jgi:aspartate racemase
MKRLGMIGGSGWPSTLEYYRLLNTYYGEVRGPAHALDLVLRNLDFEIFRELLINGKRDRALAMLAQAASDCRNAGADFLIFTANGLHRFLDELSPSIDLPFVHIADATAEVVAAKGLKRVGLLGVKPTMEGTFYPDRLKKLAVTTIVPDDSDKEIVDRIIFSELVAGQFTDKSKSIYLDIMRKLIEAGAEGIILGCTEIPLLIRETDAEFPLFATTEIHCRAALKFALN